MMRPQKIAQDYTWTSNNASNKCLPLKYSLVYVACFKIPFEPAHTLFRCCVGKAGRNILLHQAIDRTHRIGQTKNIFAYHMICKDTIDDKIIQLQEKKRLLAKELIADDATFVKALSREDVEYLFS